MIWYFIPAIVALGLITSYQDIKYGKIRNKWVILAIAYALIVNVGLIIYNLSTSGIRVEYITELLTNFIFAVLLGYLLWHFGIWTSGDGKLFIAFAALIPLSQYQYGYVQWFPAWSLLVNILVPATAVIIVTMIIRLKSPDFIEIIKYGSRTIFDYKQFIAIIPLAAISTILRISFIMLDVNVGFISRTALSILILVIADKYRKISYPASGVTLIFIGFFATEHLMITIKEALPMLILLMTAKFIFYIFLSKASSLAFSRDVKIKDLKVGMVLSESLEKRAYSDKKSDNDKQSLAKSSNAINHYRDFLIKTPRKYLNNSIIDDPPEGIDEEQISKLKKMGIKSIRVAETLPFAPFIFAGAILTIIFKGNIFIWILFLI